MKLKLTMAAAVFSCTAYASAGMYSGSYDWEDGGTILGSYGNLGYAANVLDPLGGGSGGISSSHGRRRRQQQHTLEPLIRKLVSLPCPDGD